MHATEQRPTGPNLFKPSLLAWRANYLAARAAGGCDQPAAESAPRPARIVRPRRPAGRR
jgi:hypothetical protein